MKFASVSPINDGRAIIVMGGTDGQHPLSTTQIAMPGSSTRYGPQMRERVAYHCSVSLEDKVVVTGGYRHKQPGSDVAERLDITTGEWEELGKMNYPRFYHTCATVWLNKDDLVGDILIIRRGASEAFFTQTPDFYMNFSKLSYKV